MSGSVRGTSDLPLELKGDPSCSEPDPDSLNLSSPPMNAPDLALSTPPAERVRAWAALRTSIACRTPGGPAKGSPGVRGWRSMGSACLGQRRGANRRQDRDPSHLAGNGPWRAVGREERRRDQW